jgi:hypothetical protein
LSILHHVQRQPVRGTVHAGIVKSGIILIFRFARFFLGGILKS